MQWGRAADRNTSLHSHLRTAPLSGPTEDSPQMDPTEFIKKLLDTIAESAQGAMWLLIHTLFGINRIFTTQCSNCSHRECEKQR